MSYVSQTPNLGLPQWILSEPPQMSDFNGAFSSIDQFAGEKGEPNGLATLDAEGNLVQSHAAGFKLSVAQGGTGASDPVNARSNLGLMKKLWEGNWSTGSITVPNFQNYSLIVLRSKTAEGSVQNFTMIGFKAGGALRALGGQASELGNQYILAADITYDGNVLSALYTSAYSHVAGGNHNGSTKFNIYQIYGIC